MATQTTKPRNLFLISTNLDLQPGKMPEVTRGCSQAVYLSCVFFRALKIQFSTILLKLHEALDQFCLPTLAEDKKPLSYKEIWSCFSMPSKTVSNQS